MYERKCCKLCKQGKPKGYQAVCSVCRIAREIHRAGLRSHSGYLANYLSESIVFGLEDWEQNGRKGPAPGMQKGSNKDL